MITDYTPGEEDSLIQIGMFTSNCRVYLIIVYIYNNSANLKNMFCYNLYKDPPLAVLMYFISDSATHPYTT